MRCNLVLFALVMMFCFGCTGRPAVNLDMYRRTVLHGIGVIPEAQQIETCFGRADHFIEDYGLDYSSRRWHTEVYFDGRYILSMWVEVEIDYDSCMVTQVIGEPQFVLNTAKAVAGRSLTYHSEDSRRFGRSEWQELHRSGGDIEILGIRRRHEAVAGFDEFAEKVRALRYDVRK